MHENVDRIFSSWQMFAFRHAHLFGLCAPFFAAAAAAVCTPLWWKLSSLIVFEAVVVGIAHSKKYTSEFAAKYERVRN